MKTNDAMNDAERKAAWAEVTDPLEALEELAAGSQWLGTDPYYSDMNDALWAMVGRVLEAHRK